MFSSILAEVTVVSHIYFFKHRRSYNSLYCTVHVYANLLNEILKFFIKVLLLGKAMFAVLYCISVKLKLKGELIIQFKCLVSCKINLTFFLPQVCTVIACRRL